MEREKMPSYLDHMQKEHGYWGVYSKLETDPK